MQTKPVCITGCLYMFVYYKLYRFLTVYMGSYTRLVLIWPRGGKRCIQ